MNPVRLGPTFVVAGAARAGSTAVTESLRAHPDVFVTQPKEPHYFALSGHPVAFTGPGDDITINKLAVTDLDQYLALYAKDTTFLARGEGSVSTLYYHRRSIPMMQAMNPQMRVVVILREPVARAHSSWQYLRVRGFEPVDDFLEAVQDEPRRRELGWHHLWHYTGMSRYAKSVGALVDAFGDQVCVWFYDDLDADPGRTTEAIMRFVGVDPSRAPAADSQRVNASGRPRRRVLHGAMQWAGRHDSVRSVVKHAVPFSARERIRNANLAPNAISDEIRLALAPTFNDDVTELQKVLGRAVPPSWLH